MNEPRLLHEFFERSVARDATAIAVEVPPSNSRERRSVTYGELDQRSRDITRRLAKTQSSTGVVAVFVARHDVDLFAAELAVLRAGLAYTCIDPSFPDAHVAFIVKDAGASVVIVDRVHAHRVRALGSIVEHVIVLDEALPGADSVTPAPIAPASLAYVIYTSGTTGRPKGVMIEHRSIVNLIAADVAYFALAPSDRVAQSSSHAYDSALEETWLAFSAGATVVVLDDETARLGPDLIPWLAREKISVFCPPPTLLRATGCRDPERELPDLKLLYVGGEPLPKDIADRWARGRRLENGYGPTECTVTVLRTPIAARDAITIGSPVLGNRAYVLDGDVEIDDATPGELCIGGLGLARGYLNRPQLTAEKFQDHPRLGRIYRTGDRVRREDDGRFSHLGRIDSQVKVRGFRIELSAIEAVLAEQSGVRAAACTVQDEPSGQILVAFVVPHDAEPSDRGSRVAHDDNSIDRTSGWRAQLALELPEYMVPARFAIVRDLPVTVGGKLDRSKLPRIESAGAAQSRTIVEPRSEAETVIRDAFRAVLGLAAGPSTVADFFVDLGGDSLRAAEAVSMLRANALTEHLTVRDVYDRRTISSLGELRPAPRLAPTARRRRSTLSVWRVAISNVVQICALGVVVWATAAICWVGGRGLFETLSGGYGVPLSLVLAPIALGVLLSLHAPLSIAFVRLVKRILIGKYRPARVPVFSGLYVRHWIVQKAARLIPWNAISGTAFENRALRALGAKVGERVHIHRGVALDQGGWDLLEIGDDVSIGIDAALRLVDLEDGELVIGPVKIGKGSTIETRAGLNAHSSVGENALLAALSWLPSGAHVSDGQRFDGVPARPAGSVPPVDRVDDARSWSPTTHAFVLVLSRALVRAAYALPFTLLLALLAWDARLEWRGVVQTLAGGEFPMLGATSIALAACAAVPLTLLMQALLMRALGPVREGSVNCASPTHVRIALKTDIVQVASTWLSGTLFWPWWLRMAGMRLGRDVEISTILDVVPELIEIGEESFLADGIYLGGPRVHRGVVTTARTVLGKRTFLGNHVVVRPGDRMSDDLLVGVCTVTDPVLMHADSAWFGHPPFRLPRKPQADFDRSMTHDPSLVRRVNRLLWEAARFALPVPPILIGVWAASWLATHIDVEMGLLAGSLHLAAVACTISASGALLVLVLKWVLLGRVRPGQHALWSCWCSRWDFHYVVWGLYARSVLSNLEGTSLLAWYLRAMGARVGKRVVLAGGFAQVVDPDMLEFGDDVTVHALFQAHSFEERVLKIDRVQVRAGADVGPGAVLFYGADIGMRARVLPHSVVMKMERVQSDGTYVGCPVREIRDEP